MEVVQDSHGTTVIDSPVGDARLVSPFGPRPQFRTPGGWTTADFHFGIDLVPLGLPVLGTPIEAKRSGRAFGYDNDPRDGNGLVVRLEHQRYVTEYFHTNEGAWRPPNGFQVKQGTTFAELGNTGASTGPHLHMTLRETGKRYEYIGHAGQRHVTDHIDPLSEAGLDFLNGSETARWTNRELRQFVVTAVARGEYEIKQEGGRHIITVEAELP